MTEKVAYHGLSLTEGEVIAIQLGTGVKLWTSGNDVSEFKSRISNLMRNGVEDNKEDMKRLLVSFNALLDLIDCDLFTLLKEYNISWGYKSNSEN